jgi:transposase
MDKITTVGVDLAKQVMAVHATDADGRRVIRKVLRRDQLLRWAATPCVVAMAACGGAHYWARELTRQGHTVRIIAAQFVQAFRKGGKNDANDAEAICTAVRQPNMRFVAMKSVGLAPKQHSTGGKTRLGRITKRGDAYLRTLLILGAKSALQAALRKPAQGRHRLQQWIVAVFSRIGYHKTLVAIANKHARIIWALLVKGEAFDVRRMAPTVVAAA